MKRAALTAVVSMVAVGAMALATFVGVFNSTYKVPKDSPLGKAGCMVCHMTAKGGKLNPYGADLAKQTHPAGGKKLTAEMLKKIEGLDSDGDGMSNADEIAKGRLPGVKG